MEPRSRIEVALPTTLAKFARSDSFVRFLVGPVGSGKSSACVTEILRRAARQRPGPDGVRRSRFAVIRNTYGQLKDTTRKTFEEWIPQQIGTWNEQRFTFVMDFLHNDGEGNKHPLHCEVLFRALDRPEDVKKLLSLELTGAYINEVREVPKHVLDVLETRIGRYPSRRDGGATWSGIWADSNPWHGGHWAAKMFAKLGRAEGYECFRQPGGRDPEAENVENLPSGYYQRLCVGKSSEWIKVYVDGQDASGAEGAIWGTWIAALEARGGVSGFEHSTSNVFTSWDLGRADSTAIWWWRIREWQERRPGGSFLAHRDIDVIDHYENHLEGLEHYFGVVESKPYKYALHFFPHDARAETLGTQQTVIERALERWPEKCSMTPNIGLDDGIEAARWLLEQPMRIHERCGVPGRLDYSGLDALRSYRYEWDDKAQCFGRTPLHNWASHTADAFRYLAVVAKHTELVTREEKPDERPLAVPLDGSFTLDELMADKIQSRRWNRD